MNLSRHTDLLCEFITYFITNKGCPDRRNVQTVLAYHTFSYTCCYFQFPKSWHHPSLLYDSLLRHIGLIFIFLEDTAGDCAVFTEPHGERSVCFANAVSVTFTGTMPSVAVLFLVWLSLLNS
jgi:hypothetical protein